MSDSHVGTLCDSTNCEEGALQHVLSNNRAWAQSQKEKDPEFFLRLKNQQSPEYFWLGCSDSRVPANEILGLAPGEVFVQRNVGNLLNHHDMNSMSALEYAVTELKVKHIIVCGHYNCGAVRAALSLTARAPGLVNLWISGIRDVRNKHESMLKALSPEEQLIRLCELNVQRQIFSVCTSPVVQDAWHKGQPLAVHGLIYSVEDGLLKELCSPINGLNDLAMYEAGLEENEVDGQKADPVVNDNPKERKIFTQELASNIKTHMSWEVIGNRHPWDMAPWSKEFQGDATTLKAGRPAKLVAVQEIEV